MSDVVASIASKRLHRANGAHNTTQANGAVWCMAASCYRPLGERRRTIQTGVEMSHLSEMPYTLSLLFRHTALRLYGVISACRRVVCLRHHIASERPYRTVSLIFHHTTLRLYGVISACWRVVCLRHHIASERPYRANGAHNTTQAVGAVWCMTAFCHRPLGERRRTIQTGDEKSHLSEMPYMHSFPFHHTTLRLCGVISACRRVVCLRYYMASERPYRTEGAHNTTQAVGAVWCMDTPCRRPLEERRQHCSVLKKVFLSDCNSVFDEECTILLCKTDGTVVFLLPGYISSNHFAVSHAVGEAGILLCPAIKGREMRICFQPLARRHFELLYKLGHGHCRGKRHEDMHVVGHAADAEQVPTDVVDEAEDIGVEFALVVCTDGVLTPMSAENNMVKCLCVTHAMITRNSGIYCTTSTMSPVFDRHTVGYVPQHHTAPTACMVLCAPKARSVSPTQP